MAETTVEFAEAAVMVVVAVDDFTVEVAEAWTMIDVADPMTEATPRVPAADNVHVWATVRVPFGVRCPVEVAVSSQVVVAVPRSTFLPVPVGVQTWTAVAAAFGVVLAGGSRGPRVDGEPGALLDADDWGDTLAGRRPGVTVMTVALGVRSSGAVGMAA